MGDRDERRFPAYSRELRGRAAVHLELRRTAASDDLDIAPQNAMRMAGAKRFHRRLFRSESAGKVNRRRPAAATVRNLRVGKHSTEKPFAVSLDYAGDAVDIRGVETDS